LNGGAATADAPTLNSDADDCQARRVAHRKINTHTNTHTHPSEPCRGVRTDSLREELPGTNSFASLFSISAGVGAEADA
jgi:hypothetical protein